MGAFDHYRTTPWEPSFTEMKTAEECAHHINRWHEDYPLRVEATLHVLTSQWRGIAVVPVVTRKLLKRIHGQVFAGTDHGGTFRSVNVQVGRHSPPRFEAVEDLMKILETYYEIGSIEDAIAWYTDFETIHPFQDGDGRVGGIIVAAFSHKFSEGENGGWLAPNQ